MTRSVKVFIFYLILEIRLNLRRCFNILSFCVLYLGIKSCRLEAYARKRAIYFSSTSDSTISSNLFSRIATNSGNKFSSFDDETGFNELLCPSPSTVTDFFNLFIESREIKIKQSFNSVIPHPVWSFDGTYNVQKRTQVSGNHLRWKSRRIFYIKIKLKKCFLGAYHK